MKKLNYKPALLFLLSSLLIIPVFAVFGFIFIMIVSMAGLLGSPDVTMGLVYLGYFVILDRMFYGSSKKQNQYVASLEKNRKYTVLQDMKMFLKQEGIVVILSYAVYALVALIAEIYIPNTDELILNLLKLAYRIPIFPAAVLSWPVFFRYPICVACFSVIYCAVMIWRRARIRKKWHS